MRCRWADELDFLPIDFSMMVAAFIFAGLSALALFACSFLNLAEIHDFLQTQVFGQIWAKSQQDRTAFLRPFCIARAVDHAAHFSAVPPIKPDFKGYECDR